ncbi:MAG TPA: CinA family protein [Gammaproteobacteria bacterium]|nr:CinA family protein [Gammaproteobacteria bacterium]
MALGMDEDLDVLAARLGEALRERGQRLATAESCTGGWVAKVCTDIAGSSDWFECGLVSYSNRSKQALLGVAATTLATHGAVSRETVLEMVQGALARTQADWAVAISGIAGPGGGTPDKPVGTVWLAWAGPDGWQETLCGHFPGDREAVRHASVRTALGGLLERLAHEACDE